MRSNVKENFKRKKKENENLSIDLCTEQCFQLCVQKNNIYKVCIIKQIRLQHLSGRLLGIPFCCFSHFMCSEEDMGLYMLV